MKENNIKALFPEGVEIITISKNDYDRLYGQLTYENIVLQSKIDKAIEYIKSHNPSDIGICGNSKKYYYTLDEDSVDHLLNILQDKGEDK